MAKLPTRVISIDVETDIPSPKGNIEESQPFLLGVKRYRALEHFMLTKGLA